MGDERFPMSDFYAGKAETLRSQALQARDDSVKRQLVYLALEFQRLAEHARREERVSDDAGAVATLRSAKS